MKIIGSVLLWITVKSAVNIFLGIHINIGLSFVVPDIYPGISPENFSSISSGIAHRDVFFQKIHSEKKTFRNSLRNPFRN